jgi:hypothetical protein
MAFLSPGAGGLPVFGGGFFLIRSVFWPFTFSFLRPEVVAGLLMGERDCTLVVENCAAPFEIGFNVEVAAAAAAAILLLLVLPLRKEELRMLVGDNEGRARQRRQFVLAIVLLN